MSIGKNGTRQGERAAQPLEQRLAAWSRRERSTGVDWTRVDARLLAAALAVCVAADVNLTIGAALGGRGVILTPYRHPIRWKKEVVITAVELEEYLWALIDEFASPAEDIPAAWGLTR